MELIGSSSASASTKLHLPRGEYEVFLSFRGPDVRTTFADHLYQFLDNYGIRTFLDNEELRGGEKFAPEIMKAIEESKVYVPIFSPGYASSKWCLREAAHMLKCCKEDKGRLILPIYYLMEPRDVRHQKRSYEEAFQRHGEVYGQGTVKEWREALHEVGQIQGWEVNQSERQGAIVREVFSRLRSHLMGSYLLVTEQLISVEPHVEKVTKLLNKGVKVVGIVGMGGIGKTTIAMAVRDEIYTKFDRCCFLRDVRETWSGKEGILALQKQIMIAILGHDGNIQNTSQGIRLIKDRVCKHKVLIFIDDADERFEFRQVLGNLEDFSSASQFIITTRNQRVLEYLEHELYTPAELDHDHSLQLFSRHAFGLDYPPKDRVALSEEFVKVATGLPLALKVIGSTLNRKNERFWDEKLKQLKKIPHSEVQERLMISYLDLTREERQIFLDIACTFIGVSKEQPFFMWSDCDFYPEIGIDALILKSLIRVNEKNEIWMHDSIRDLGRAIIRGEDSQRPWRRSRIWSNEDALDILTNEEGTDRLEILTVDIECKQVKLTQRQFEKLSGLRYLKVIGGELAGNFQRVLPNIRWIELHNCFPIPDDLNMKKLVIFHLQSCPVTDDWIGWKRSKVAQKMKSVSLSHCTALEKAPDLSRCRNLEFLNFDYCPQMSGELHIGDLKNLKVLNLVDTRIKRLTGNIVMLQNLQEIKALNAQARPFNVNYRLSSPELLEMQTKQLEWKEVPPLPTSLRRLYLQMPYVVNLMDLKNLEDLWFFDCDAPPVIPGDVWRLSKLKSLKLSHSPCRSLLVKDETGDKVAALPSSLNSLEILHCEPLKILPSLANLINLTQLILRGTNVHEICGLGELKLLTTFKLSGARNLATLEGLQHLIRLNTLSLERCLLLKKLPSLSNLAKLQTLVIAGCELLYEIHGLGELRECLSYLEITSCPSLVYTEGHGSLEYPTTVKPLLPSLSNLDRLSKLILGLEVSDVNHTLPQEQSFDLSSLRNLLELSISGSKWLVEVNGLERLELLESLCIKNLPSLRKLNLSGLGNLKELVIKRCLQLTELIGLENLISLQSLRMQDCTSITELLDPILLEPLRMLYITGCPQLTESFPQGFSSNRRRKV